VTNCQAIRLQCVVSDLVADVTFDWGRELAPQGVAHDASHVGRLGCGGDSGAGAAPLGASGGRPLDALGPKASLRRMFRGGGKAINRGAASFDRLPFLKKNTNHGLAMARV